ncbi:Uncharacterised protein [Acinetobacter baumannii]|nr:Uncharacterised protein [Acinetobacter baumannii]
MTRSLTMVGWLSMRWKRASTPAALRLLARLSAASSRPVTPTSKACAPSAAMFSATLAAPPGRSSCCSTRTTGTGASGEMREVAPCQ